MSTIRSALFALVATTLLAGHAAPARPPVALSIGEATRAALRDSPAYRLALADVERARGARLGAAPLLPDNPVI